MENNLQSIDTAIEKSPIILAWSKTPFKFYTVVSSVTLTGSDDTNYTIEEIPLSEQDMKEAKENFKGEPWESSLIETLFGIELESTSRIPEELKDNEYTLTILSNPVNKSLFAQLVEKQSWETEETGLIYFGSIKINKQLYMVKFSDEVPENTVVIGNMLETEFFATIPVGKIILMD